MNLKSFFNPKTIAIVGVSESKKKLGSVILQNLIDAKYKGEIVPVNPKYVKQKFNGQKCLAKVSDHKTALDLVVIVVPASSVEKVIDDCIKNKTKNVIVISAGFGEIGNDKIESKISEKCTKAKINLLGPNCLGAIFPSSGINASFSDGFPSKGHIAFISQSGAFCTATLDWALQKDIGFSHFISLGNKAGLSEIDFLENLAEDPQVKIFALYLESIEDGAKLIELIQRISPKKPIIILEPGKSRAAKAATSSHTGALSPNAQVTKAAYRNAGAIQVFSMREMFGLLEVLTFNGNKNFGKRVAILTNAGGVGVLTTDLVEDEHLELAKFAPTTIKNLGKKLPKEANIQNPVDLVGDADGERYRVALDILGNDPNIDQILVLLTPQRTTQVRATAEFIAKFAKKTKKNVVASFIGGRQIKSGLGILQKNKVPSFDFPSDALEVLGLLANKEHSKVSPTIKTKRDIKIETLLKEAKKLKSLPASSVYQIAKKYKLDTPQSQNFTDFKKAKNFAQKFFPKNVVLKISSPDAIHKTELKGVFLNVNSVKKFEEAWQNLSRSIEIAKLKEAEIQIQEQIESGTEIILGINTDPNFGKVLLFGAGGIYTEIFHDTTLRVLPTADFPKMIQETKIGEVLQGARGKKLAARELIKIMENLQQLVFDYPEIKSIDMNPVIITPKRAVVVDFKIIL
ncbi:acetate--CoA ligase family protein [Candidatus Gracilibacteria bacterium]|nr:acetate--CoA ligase family protein [Candidatus Gracilibacteria bacterium]